MPGIQSMFSSPRSATTSVLIASAAIILVGCGGAQSRLASHMHRGQEYFDQGNFAKASVEFHNAMRIVPDDLNARIMAARAAEGAGKTREAVGLYQSVIDTSSDNVEARARLGRLMVLAGATAQAQKTIEPSLARHPDAPDLLIVRASVKLQLGDLEGAVADADRALQLAPTNEDAIDLRAGLYRQHGDIEQAISLVSDAVRHLPGSVNLRRILADLYTAADKPDLAEEQLRTLITLRPNQPEYRYQLATFYARTHNIDQAQRVLEDAVKALPNSNEAKLALADFVSSQRGRADGEKLLRAFIAHEPDDYDLRLGLGALLQHFQATDEAVRTYEEVVRRDLTGPYRFTALNRLAGIAFTEDRQEDARKLVEQVLQKNPRNNDALLLRAELALQQTGATAAIVDLRAILKDQPQAVSVRRLLARAYDANGQSALAEETLRGLLELTPGDVALRVELAQSLVRTGRTEEAIAVLEHGVHDAPGDLSVREALAKAYLAKHDFPSARAAAEDLKVLQPSSGVAFYLDGLVAEAQNDMGLARREFERSVATEPKNYQWLANLVRFEREQGQLERAVSAARKAADADSSNPMLPNLLGELYLAQNNVALADEALTHAAKLAPQWWLPVHNLALAKRAAGDTAAAIQIYQAGLQALPKQPELVMDLALLYEQQGRVEDALACYETFHRRNPTVQRVANNLAMLLVTYRSDRASLDRARDLTASFASSSDGTLLDTNGWVHFKRSEYGDALAVLRRAVERSPDSKEIRYHLGMTELRAGHPDRARDALETALDGATPFSGSDEARTALAALKQRTG